MNEYRVIVGENVEHIIYSERMVSGDGMLSFFSDNKLVAQFRQWGYWYRVVPKTVPERQELVNAPAKDPTEIE